MRLAVMSDVHGNLPALEAAMVDIARRAPDSIVNLADCVTNPLWPSETLEELESLALPTVRGNHVNEAGTHAHYAIATRRASGWTVDLFAIEYD